MINQFANPGPDHFVVEGRFCVEALLLSGEYEVVSVLRADGAHKDFDTRFLHLTDVWTAPKKAISEAIGYSFHRGILALARRPGSTALNADSARGLLVSCPEIADESNLGAIVRTTAALGGDGILIQAGRGADIYSRKAIRASSGAVFRLPIYQVQDLHETIGGLKRNKFSVVATGLSEDSIDLMDCYYAENCVVMFGPEKDGLSPRWLEWCDQFIQIPMANGMDSLNVSATAAIVLHHFSIGRRT